MTDSTNNDSAQPEPVGSATPAENVTPHTAPAEPVAPQAEPGASQPHAQQPVAPQQPAVSQQPVAPPQAAPQPAAHQHVAPAPNATVYTPNTPPQPYANQHYAQQAGAQPAYAQAPQHNPYAQQHTQPTVPLTGAAFGVGGPGGPTGAAPGTPAPAPKRKGSGLIVASIAIAALLGGAAGAGVVALSGNQNSDRVATTSSSQQNVVVNNTDSVTQITAVAAKATPSVVTISVSGQSAGGTGSGVVLSSDGYVLTNTHVVTLDGESSNPQIQVTMSDGRLFAATIVGTDPISDLAVIKLTGASGLTPLKFADSSKLNVGDTAIAIGAPLGLEGTVTNGIISALNRSITVSSSAVPPTSPDSGTPDQGNGQAPYDFWNNLPGQGGNQQQAPAASAGSISLAVIQTDAAINPGNSGGALLNSNGEVMGINVAIATAGNNSQSGSIGVGFAIPANVAQRVANEIIKDGTATHGLLGATVSSSAAVEGSTIAGAAIQDVTPGGAAAQAGLQKGDIVTRFNGVPVSDANDLTAQVRTVKGGGDATLSYVRNGQSYDVSVTLGTLGS